MDEPRWTVTGQTETSLPNARGGYSHGWTVQFRTATGTAGTLQVFDADYTPNKVAALIDAKVDTIDAIHNLTGPPAGG